MAALRYNVPYRARSRSHLATQFNLRAYYATQNFCFRFTRFNAGIIDFGRNIHPICTSAIKLHHPRIGAMAALRNRRCSTPSESWQQLCHPTKWAVASVRDRRWQYINNAYIKWRRLHHPTVRTMASVCYGWIATV